QLLIRTLPDIFSAEITPRKQIESAVTYAPNISREIEKIDWTETDEAIYNKIRGLNPWPVAYTKFEGQRMKVTTANLTNEKQLSAEPGQVVEVSEAGIKVVCGNQKIVNLTTIQIAGKKR